MLQKRRDLAGRKKPDLPSFEKKNALIKALIESTPFRSPGLCSTGVLSLSRTLRPRHVKVKARKEHPLRERLHLTLAIRQEESVV